MVSICPDLKPRQPGIMEESHGSPVRMGASLVSDFTRNILWRGEVMQGPCHSLRFWLRNTMSLKETVIRKASAPAKHIISFSETAWRRLIKPERRPRSQEYLIHRAKDLPCWGKIAFGRTLRSGEPVLAQICAFLPCFILGRKRLLGSCSECVRRSEHRWMMHSDWLVIFRAQELVTTSAMPHGR